MLNPKKQYPTERPKALVGMNVHSGMLRKAQRLISLQ